MRGRCPACKTEEKTASECGLNADRSSCGPPRRIHSPSPWVVLTIATMPARIDGGRSARAGTTAARSGSVLSGWLSDSPEPPENAVSSGDVLVRPYPLDRPSATANARSWMPGAGFCMVGGTSAMSLWYGCGAGAVGRGLDWGRGRRYPRGVRSGWLKLVVLLAVLPQLVVFGGRAALAVCLGSDLPGCEISHSAPCESECGHPDWGVAATPAEGHDEHCGCTDLLFEIECPIATARTLADELAGLWLPGSERAAIESAWLARLVPQGPGVCRRSVGRPPPVTVAAAAVRSTRLRL